MERMLDGFLEMYPCEDVKEAFLELFKLGLDLSFHRELKYYAGNKTMQLEYCITCAEPAVIASADSPIKCKELFIESLPPPFRPKRPVLRVVPPRARPPVQSDG